MVMLLVYYRENIMLCDFDNLIIKRRSVYDLGQNVLLSDNDIVHLIENAVKYCPTAFNSQSGRVVVLFAKESQKFWNIVEEELRKLVGEGDFAKTKSKIDAFAKGLGTILFFEDMDVIKNFEEKYSLYKDNFAIWSQQANGMLQYMIWTALAEKNIGASLQHYNPLVDEKVMQQWNVPQSWKLVAQMPFGSIEKSPKEKSFEPLNSRVKVF